MYEFISDDTEYTFPTGKKMFGRDMKTDSEYSFVSLFKYAVDIVDGVVSAFRRFSELKNETGIDDSDDSIALSKINAYYAAQKSDEYKLVTSSSQIFTAAKIFALTLTDEQALEVPDLYSVYEVDHAYKKDERFNYNGRLFKVNQAHTSAAQWVPGETGTESLYTCLEMAGDGYLVWTQPTGAHNAYNTGDIVHYPTEDDPLYKSLIDGNTWSPDAYPRGWEIYNEA